MIPVPVSLEIILKGKGTIGHCLVWTEQQSVNHVIILGDILNDKIIKIPLKYLFKSLARLIIKKPSKLLISDPIEISMLVADVYDGSLLFANSIEWDREHPKLKMDMMMNEWCIQSTTAISYPKCFTCVLCCILWYGI